MATTTILGSGCGFPLSTRNFTSLLCQSETTTILLDAGEPVSRTLRQGDFDFGTLDAICLSHGHSDHTGGFFMLIQTLWLTGRTQELPVYLPGELIGPLQTWLETVYLSNGILPFTISYHAWKNERSVSIGDLTLTPYPSTHLDDFRQRLAPEATGRFCAHCFRIETGSHSMVWSADIGRPEDLEPALRQPANLLITETAHFPPEDLLQLVARHEVAEVVLTHFPQNTADYYTELRNLGNEILPDSSKMQLAEDGLRLEW